MRKRILIGAVICAAFALSNVEAQGPPRKEPTGAELVRQLADPSFRVREKAEQELLRLGDDCLVELRRGAADDDLEIRRRCQKILGQIPQSPADVFLEPFLARKEDAKAVYPGWKFLRELIGDDNGSRRLFAKLYKSDSALLDAIEKDAKSVAVQLEPRLQKVFPRITAAMRRAGETPQHSNDDIAALFLVANAAKANVDLNASQRILNLFYQPVMQQTFAYSDVTRRLAGKWLETKCDDAQLAQQVANAAVILECEKIIEDKLRPTTAKLIDDAAANPSDLNLVYRAINMANMLGMRDALERKLRPAVIKGIATAVREPIDVNKLNQLTNVVQSLGGFDNQLQLAVRPALVTLIKKQAENVDDLTKFYTILNLARATSCQDLLEDHLVPAVRESMIRGVSQPGLDFNKLTQKMYHAQNLGMHEEIESMLKPAAQRMIAAALAGNADAVKYQQAFSAAQAFQLRESLVPLAKKLLEESVAAPHDINRISQAVQLARSANVPDIDDFLTKKVKPAASAGLVSLAKSLDGKSDAAKLVPAMLLADQLQLKEGVDVALAALGTKTLPAYQRSQALFMLAKNGTKDAVHRIETLLDEKTELGTASFNGVTIRAQLRDVALATCVQLSGQKLTDYEFPFFKMNGQIIINQGVSQPPGWYGFENDAARNAAQKKYRESRAAK